MHIQICGGSKTLYEGNRAGLRLGAFQACLFGQKGRDGAIDHPQERRKQLGMSSQEKSQRNRKRQHPLAHRHLRNHFIHQVSGGLGHASCAASGANAAALRTLPVFHGGTHHNARAENHGLRCRIRERPRTPL